MENADDADVSLLKYPEEDIVVPMAKERDAGQPLFPHPLDAMGFARNSTNGRDDFPDILSACSNPHSRSV